MIRTDKEKVKNDVGNLESGNRWNLIASESIKHRNSFGSISFNQNTFLATEQTPKIILQG